MTREVTTIAGPCGCCWPNFRVLDNRGCVRGSTSKACAVYRANCGGIGDFMTYEELVPYKGEMIMKISNVMPSPRYCDYRQSPNPFRKILRNGTIVTIQLGSNKCVTVDDMRYYSGWSIDSGGNMCGAPFTISSVYTLAHSRSYP